MALTEQLTIDRKIPLRLPDTETDWRSAGIVAERAARESLRAQIAKLEHELSGIVAGRFPHISPGPASAPAGWAGPHLLSLEELERLRDRLVLRVHGAQGQSLQRAALERRARDLLERMKEEPGRYKFVRLPVADLGEHGCGVWEVRPRLGLIGMLAGWWQVKLSSGCPLRWPRAHGARLLRTPSSAAPRALEGNGPAARCKAARSHARLQMARPGLTLSTG